MTKSEVFGTGPNGETVTRVFLSGGGLRADRKRCKPKHLPRTVRDLNRERGDVLSMEQWRDGQQHHRQPKPDDHFYRYWKNGGL